MLWWTTDLRRTVLLGPLLLLTLTLAVGGCVSSRSTADIAADRNEVLGVWEYRTNGTTLLQRGTLRITVENGRLVGRLRDTWRGPLEARVNLHGSHMELDFRQVRIIGRLRRGRFEAAIRREFMDASVSSTARPRPGGYFVAQRVRSPSPSRTRTDYGCPSLLRERSYSCSPFQSE